MGTTSNLDLPYPEFGVAPAGPTQIQALAEAVDDRVRTWPVVGMTYATGAGTGSPENLSPGTSVYRSGRVGVLMLNMRFVNSYTSGVTFGTIPEGYRPVSQARAVMTLGGLLFLVTIESTGAVLASAAGAANSQVYGSATYITAP